MPSYTDNSYILSSITATGVTSSNAFEIGKRSQVAVQLVSTGISSGNGAFTLEVSNDGRNWIKRAAYYDPQTTTLTSLTTSTVLTTNTSAGMVFSNALGWQYCRVSVNVTTDGTYSAILEAAG